MPAGLHVLASRQGSGRGERRAFSFSVMPVTIECENPECDESFTVPPSHVDDRSHCSRECHQEVRRRESIVTVECDRKGCEQVIQEQRGNLEWRRREHDAVFCSDRCRSLASRTGKMLTCQECGEEFYEPGWKIESDRHSNIYCGAECRHGKEIQSGEWLVSTCECCGSEFEYFTTSSNGRYCSLSCYRESLRPDGVRGKPNKECLRCGDSFPVPPSKVKEYKYCSEDCRKGIVRLFGEPVMKQCAQCNKVKSVSDFPKQFDKRRDAVYTLRMCNECREQAKRRRRELPGSFTAADVRSQWHTQNGCCFWCGKRCGKTPHGGNYHIDHLTPVARKEAEPTNNPRNLVISCPACNIAKGAKLPIEFKRYRLQNGKERTYAFGVSS